MSKTNYLPICIFTYTRINHLKQTINALQENTLAKYSEIFIFSDGPKKGDEVQVYKLRQYLHSINGFKKIHIIEQKDNDYIKNTVGSAELILKKYGEGIFLEDDIITAPGFLQFMNDSSKYYKNNTNVFSISGYSPPIKSAKNCDKDFFILKRFCGWGNIIWADKYFKLKPLTKKDFLESDKKEISKYGLDLLTMMEKQVNNELNANDVNMMFHQYKNNMYTIYPKKSLVQNIGHDGSGVHCKKTNRFHHDELWDKKTNFLFENDISIDNNILQANFDFRFSMNKYGKEFILNNLVEQIKESAKKNFSIYGIGEMTNLLLIKLFLEKIDIDINFFIDSNAHPSIAFSSTRPAVQPG